MNASLRYTLRHARRAVVKSLLAILLALLLAAAVGRLDALRRHYDALCHSVEVKGVVSGGLSVYRAEKLGEAEEIKYSYLEYLRQGAEFMLSDDSFHSCILCFSSDYTVNAGAEAEWLEGWDQERFQAATGKVCLITETLAAELEIAPGDRIRISGDDYLNKLRMGNPGATMEELMEAYKRNRSPTTVVGLVPNDSFPSRLWLPIHGMGVYSETFPDLKVEYAFYTLRDYEDIQAFRERFLTETAREKGNPSLYLDTVEADRVHRMANLLNTLYPIAVGIALLLGAVLPGLMVLQNSRETAILRVLGMSRKRVCAMLTGEQVLLCILGLILGVAAAFFLGAGWELTYPGLHLAACLMGSVIFAWVSTGKDLLSLLQAKE